MSRFQKLSQSIWCCQYHIVWVPKYRFRILQGEVAAAVEECIRTFSDQQKCKIEELNVQLDHVHLMVLIPPKISVSDYVGTVKGRTAIKILNRFRQLRQKPYWGNHLWARGYCVDTVGLDEEMTGEIHPIPRETRKAVGSSLVLKVVEKERGQLILCLLRGQRQIHSLTGVIPIPAPLGSVVYSKIEWLGSG